jgi:hypothetical protein
LTGVAEVLAGFICGFILALISTPVLVVWLVRSREATAFVARSLPKGVSLPVVTVPAANIAFLLWTALGIVLGMVLIAVDERRPQGGLGSANLFFTVIVLLVAVIVFLPLFVLLRRSRRIVVLHAVCFVTLFGWLTPYLAQLNSH